MDLLALAAAAALMGAIITGLMAFYYTTASPRSSLGRRLDTLMTEGPGYDSAARGAEALRPTRIGRLPIISTLLEGKEWTEATATRLEGADIRLTVSEFVALRVFLALILGLLPFVLIGGSVGIILFLVLGLVGFSLPNFHVNNSRSKRINQLNNQLPDMLSMIANALKAGFGLMQSLDLTSREMAHPVATELRRALHDINVGSTTEEALQNMAKRSGSDDFDIVITAMLVQQSTGGNLAEILDTVAHTMRERVRIRGEIKTLTSQQMLTGVVIGALPIFLGFFIMIINPDYMQPLFTETAGRFMLVGASVMEFFGIMIIRRILAIEL